MAYSRIRPRRGTAYEWSTINPILEEGEWGVEVPDGGTGTGFSRLKIGTGDLAWNDLPYSFDGTAAASIDGGTITNFHVIQIRAASTADWSDLDPIINKNEITYDMTKNAFKVGNGEDSWTDLPYTNSGSLVDDLFDFGNEDGEEEIHSAANRLAVEGQVEALDYPDSIFDPVEAPAPKESEATLEDILDAPEESDVEDAGEETP